TSAPDCSGVSLAFQTGGGFLCAQAPAVAFWRLDSPAAHTGKALAHQAIPCTGKQSIKIIWFEGHSCFLSSKPNMQTSAAPATATLSSPWWKELNRYHWFVLVVAALGWLFDCFDQQIFTMSRSITMRDLLPQAEPLTQVKFGTWATSIFILGWATGGLIFGKMGDQWGRAKTMGLTILVYALCTGLSGLANTW